MDMLLSLLICLELVLGIAMEALFFRKHLSKSARLQRRGLQQFIALLESVLLLFECSFGVVELTTSRLKVVLKLGYVLLYSSLASPCISVGGEY